jgi:hypothetical protein
MPHVEVDHRIGVGQMSMEGRIPETDPSRSACQQGRDRGKMRELVEIDNHVVGAPPEAGKSMDHRTDQPPRGTTVQEMTLRDLLRSFEDLRIAPEREEINFGIREPLPQLPQDGKEENDVSDAMEFHEKDFPGLRWKLSAPMQRGKKGKERHQGRSEVSIHDPLEAEVCILSR